MEYNTSRTRMLMPEYGRNVQKMVEYVMTIEDRAQRLRNAEVVIELMGTLNPHLKVIEDYKHKLWDHLYQMTNFNLDVDSPYPPPTPEAVFKKPEVLPYPQKTIHHRHLGHNLDELLKKALAEKDGERKQGFTQAIGYYMKLAYTNWHREPVHDDMIKNELSALSDGQLKYETGGYKVHFDVRSQFKQNSNNGGRNNNNRNFKGGGGSSSGGGGNANRLSSNNGNNNDRGGYSNNNGYNKNKKYNKNKGK